MKDAWPSTERCNPGTDRSGTASLFQNRSVEMPMTAPGVRIGATITA